MKRIIYSIIATIFMVNCYSQSECVRTHCEPSVIDSKGQVWQGEFRTYDDNGNNIKDKEENWVGKNAQHYAENYYSGIFYLVSPHSGYKYEFKVICDRWEAKPSQNYYDNNSYNNQNYSNPYSYPSHNTSAPGIK